MRFFPKEQILGLNPSALSILVNGNILRVHANFVEPIMLAGLWGSPRNKFIPLQQAVSSTAECLSYTQDMSVRFTHGLPKISTDCSFSGLGLGSTKATTEVRILHGLPD